MAPRTTRGYTYVDEIRELRREAGRGAMRVLREARRLGVPRRLAEHLADKVQMYKLTPEEALAKLREQAKDGKRRRRAK